MHQSIYQTKQQLPQAVCPSTNRVADFLGLLGLFLARHINMTDHVCLSKSNDHLILAPLAPYLVRLAMHSPNSPIIHVRACIHGQNPYKTVTKIYF